jgi:hypothetical protein
MKHAKMKDWDDRLKELFDRIDAELEERYHGAWALRRNRPALGETSNPEADGLFNIGAVFTPGYGSAIGRGYLVDITLASSEEPGPEKRAEIESHVVRLLESLLPEYFPGRSLKLSRDGSMYKIHGDLSLGSV